MSINNTVSKTIYNGDGNTIVFPFTYQSSPILVYSSADVVVTIVDIVSGVSTTKTITSDYSVGLVAYGNAGQYLATITMITAPSLTEQLVLQRVLPITQLVSTTDNEGTPASTLNQLYDRTICLVQQVQEQIGRAILGAVNQTSGTIPPPAVGKVLGWDGLGNLTNVTVNDGSYLSKASQAIAEASSDDAAYMTALQVKNEVQKSGAVAIPAANISGLATIPTIASQAEAEAGTENTKYLSSLRTAQAIAAQASSAKYYSGAFTRDMTAATGSVSYTGVGFTPKALIVMSAVDGSATASWTFITATTDGGIGQFASGGAFGSAAGVSIYADLSNHQTGILTAFGADGFTLSWTKVGSPTGTAGAYYLAIG